jgi:hypothetical protein
LNAALRDERQRQRKKVQRSKSEVLLREMVKNAPWPRWEHDARKRCVDNDDALEIGGQSSGETGSEGENIFN